MCQNRYPHDVEKPFSLHRRHVHVASVGYCHRRLAGCFYRRAADYRLPGQWSISSADVPCAAWPIRCRHNRRLRHGSRFQRQILELQELPNTMLSLSIVSRPLVEAFLIASTFFRRKICSLVSGSKRFVMMTGTLPVACIAADTSRVFTPSRGTGSPAVPMRYQVAGKSRIRRETRCDGFHGSQLAGNACSKIDTVPGRCFLRVAFSIATAIWVCPASRACNLLRCQHRGHLFDSRWQSTAADTASLHRVRRLQRNQWF